MISLDGFNEKIVTFETDSELTSGVPVVMSGNNKVAAAAADGVFIGFVSSSSDDAAAIKVGGYTEANYSGTAPTLGISVLATAADGKVKAAAAGRTVLVTSVDTASSTVGFIL